MKNLLIFTILFGGILSCNTTDEKLIEAQTYPEPEFTLTKDQTHNKFSRTISPVLTVPSGAVIDAYTEDALDEQILPGMTTDDFNNLEYNSDLVHAITGPVYVEGAEKGDILEVILHKIECGSWGWTTVGLGGFLEGEVFEPMLKTFELSKDIKEIECIDGMVVTIEPFAGVMGVAPDTDELLSTIPPRANGGNMDDPDIIEGTKVYFPVFVEGALFSIGDLHAAQGAGEVCGTAIEMPGRVVYEVNVIKGGREIKEPQYETPDTYAVTAFATTLDEAGRKANMYMIDYLMQEHAMARNEAYMLCSLAGDLKIAEVVDGNMLVSMHMPKNVFRGK